MPRNDGSGLRLIILLLLTLLCLSVSCYQMWKSYEAFVGPLVSGLLSLVVMLVLLYLVYDLHRARRAQEPVGKILGWYVLCALLGIVASFNIFYGLFLKNELLRSEVEGKMATLYELKREAKDAIYASKGITPRVQGLLSQLEVQIKSSNDKGCGPKCEDILTDIEVELGLPPKRGLRRLKSPPQNLPPDELNKALNTLVFQYEQQIIGPRQTEFLNKFDDELELRQRAADQAVKYLADDAKQEINNIVNSYNSRAIQAKELSGGRFSAEQMQEAESVEVGEKIGATFRSASRHPTHWGTWAAVFAALMVNLFAPLFVLSFTGAGASRAHSFGRRGAENLS